MRLPDEWEWPRWESNLAWRPDPRRFRVFFRFRMPEKGAGGCFRWAVRLFGYEVAWIHRADPQKRQWLVNGGYLMGFSHPYRRESDFHWPRPYHLRRGWTTPGGTVVKGIGGKWWQPW